jgi:preprotein translocase subunit SecB
MKIKMAYKSVSKYIKNLTFKIPWAKSYFIIEKNIRNYRIKIDVTSKKLKENIIEIDTNLYFEPKDKDKDKDNFKISILFSSLINYEKKIDGKELEKIVLIEVPTAVYPDVKKIVSLLFEKSGFKEFNLPEMNFQKLYETKKN